MRNEYGTTSDSLTHYLTDIQGLAYLSFEEEQELAQAWRDRRDEDALNRLAGSHLRLVVKLARGFSGYGLPLSDLIAEGNVGLMQAIAKFDPDRGFRLSTYASWWIRAAIHEYVLHNWSLVKMGTTAAQKKLFFNLRRLKSELETLGEGDMSAEAVTAIAERLSVPETEVVEMNRRLGAGDLSLNAAVFGFDGESEWQDMLVDETHSQESRVGDAQELALRRRLLKEALSRLNDRERHILSERRLRDQPLTLEDLSHQYGVSRERIRQIEARALEKLQKAIRALAYAMTPDIRVSA
ncbi:MAG: RNA polymerase sigma factor RpoH [Inquilinaceae bacterium]